MSDEDVRARADRRFAAALERTGARDPRDFYRARLRELRERDEEAFREALAHYENELLPAVAREDSDPIAVWLEYGRLLARLTVDGAAVQIDPSGRALPYRPPVPLDHLVLHLPTASRTPVLPIGIPPQLSPAQRATYELLVKQALG
jgi:hypothetical protein